jgi:hypothetical protein
MTAPGRSLPVTGPNAAVPVRSKSVVPIAQYPRSQVSSTCCPLGGSFGSFRNENAYGAQDRVFALVHKFFGG